MFSNLFPVGRLGDSSKSSIRINSIPTRELFFVSDSHSPHKQITITTDLLILFATCCGDHSDISHLPSSSILRGMPYRGFH
jgi:hypothetical protein